MNNLTKKLLHSCAAFALLSLATTVDARAMMGMDDMGQAMDMMGDGGPMVEMPQGMSKGDFPSGSVHMMMTPEGEKAFVPWYLTKGFKTMMGMRKGTMMDGVMMQMDDGNFAFVPWYLAPQFSKIMTKKMDMERGMVDMGGGDMSYMFVPWYKQ